MRVQFGKITEVSGAKVGPFGLAGFEPSASIQPYPLENQRSSFLAWSETGTGSDPPYQYSLNANLLEGNAVRVFFTHPDGGAQLLDVVLDADNNVIRSEPAEYQQLLGLAGNHPPERPEEVQGQISTDQDELEGDAKLAANTVRALTEKADEDIEGVVVSTGFKIGPAGSPYDMDYEQLGASESMIQANNRSYRLELNYNRDHTISAYVFHPELRTRDLLKLTLDADNNVVEAEVSPADELVRLRSEGIDTQAVVEGISEGRVEIAEITKRLAVQLREVHETAYAITSGEQES